MPFARHPASAALAARAARAGCPTGNAMTQRIVLAAGQIGPDATATPRYACTWAGTAADMAR